MSEFYNENISTIFDKHFMKNLKYLPWIGKNFNNSKDRILIVGESVYNWGKNEKEKQEINEKLEKSDFIRNHIKYHGFFHSLNEKQKGGGKKGKLFSNLEKTFYGVDEVSNVQIINFWENVAFYEFCQKAMENIRERPTKNDYKNGAKEIYSIIKTINPKLIILLGTDYNKVKEIQNIVKGIFYAKDKKIDSFMAKRIDFELNGKKIIIAIGHPSSSFRKYNWRNWTEYLITNINS